MSRFRVSLSLAPPEVLSVMLRHGSRLLLAALLLAFLGGCQKSPPSIVVVEGRVLINGQPLPKAEVRFYPMIDFGGEYIASGITDENGNYSLTCMGQKGACSGENRVTITEGPMPEEFRGMSEQAQIRSGQYQQSLKNRPIPGKYANLAQSPLTTTVKPDQKAYNFELTR